MKDSEFIELLNLYLDHEITKADAARLEAEVQTNAERRRLYQQYCRMQKACKLVAVDFQPESTAGAASQEKVVVPFEAAPNRRNSMRALYSAGAVAAAAACVALILTGRPRPDASGASVASPEQVAVQTPSVPAVAAVVAPPADAATKVTPAAGGIVQRPMLVNEPLFLAGRTQADGEYATVVAQGNDQLDWIRTLRLAPLQQRVPIEDLRFDAHPATLSPEARVLGGSQNPSDSSVESAVLRFVK